jgi:tRNA U34 5-carboxymethylaminomethyl modifying GTPase MnmE/TrmE
VSAKTGAGIGELRAFLLARGSAGSRTPGLPVLAALDGASAALRAALAPPAGSPDELRCAELQRALQLLGQLGTSHAPEDLLDRIFGRFCLGK